VICSYRGAPTYRHTAIHGNSIRFTGDDGFDCGPLSALQDFEELTVASWIGVEQVPSTGMYRHSHAVSKTADSVQDGGFAFNQAESWMVFTLDAD
jgi:hypothetical protein